MELKKLNIKGFKSFANETNLVFNDGVTAIVGPNGSGKSNIIEAIRWVMGEQSAKSLRGGRMHDVIFSGTKDRPKMNMAQVELVLDNSDRFLPIDFDEVSIMRKISRSGDSVYQINKKNCRLKDITHLFLDSGLGRESFSIISQGQVESVFNAKPVERRAIFEEVAGVFKYKVQKEEAERKLEATQDNLDRVQDILYEIDAQVKPLEKQAETAEIYFATEKELEQLDLQVTAHQIQSIAEERSSLEDKKSTLHKKLAEDEHIKSSVESELKQARETLLKNEQEQEKLNTYRMENIQNLEQTRSALKVYDEKKKNQSDFLRTKTDELDRNQQLYHKLKNQLSDQQIVIDRENDELKLLNRKRQQLLKKESHLNQNPTERKEALQAEYIQLLQERATTNNQLQHLANEFEKNQKESLRFKREYQSISHRKKELMTKKAEQLKLLDQKQQRVTDLLNTYEKKETAYKKKQKKVSQIDERYQLLSNQQHQIQSEQTAIKTMQENYSGYYAGVRSIMTNKEQLGGIVGTVAELISPPSHLLQAIDTALAASSQFIVVTDEAAGRQAINYLKKHRAGRATLLPITAMKPRFVPKNILEKIQYETGFVGVASDLFEFPDQIKPVVEHLLGHILIAENLKAATHIAKQTNHRFKVVTYDGDVINPGGSMTGGRLKEQARVHPVFLHREKLKKLAIKKNEVEQTLRTIEKHRQQLRVALQEVQTELQSISDQGVAARQEEQSLQTQFDQTAYDLRQTERAVEGATFEQRQLSEFSKSLEQDVEKYELKKKKIQQEIDEIDVQLASLSFEEEDRQTKKEELTHQVEELEDKRQELREKTAVLKSEYKHLLNQKDEIKQTIQTLQRELDDFQKVDQELSVSDLTIQEKEYADQREFLEERLLNLRNESEETHSFEMKREKDLNDLAQKIHRAERRLNQYEVKISQAEVRLDYLLNYLVDEYKVSFEDITLEEMSDKEIKEAESAVKQLKEKIDHLGPVNLGAIEEYEVVYERWSFLTSQQRDLIEAKEKLYETMNEMDSEVKQRFKETFNQIKEQFSKVFPEMFGGGRAELYLTEPDNLLETGVEIIAQPPGKKLTRLSLLSGGERALTAISLLFSIIQVRPIPFCILDEVESSLDEANVSRFGRYLRSFETDTQFIVITHRKGTMEEANRLYGVTMQERGVSKLVTVSLEETEGMSYIV